MCGEYVQGYKMRLCVEARFRISSIVAHYRVGSGNIISNMIEESKYDAMRAE